MRPASPHMPARDEPALRITTVTTAPVLVVRARGDLDRDTGPLLTGYSRDLLDRYPSRPFLLDLADIGYLGAAGITALLHVRGDPTEEDVRLQLYRPSPTVLWILDTVGLTDTFVITD